VSRGILNCPKEVSKALQLLPLESVAVFHDGHKISGECGTDARFHIGMVEARAFYISHLGWYAATFDNVDWKSRDKCLAPKPDMFKMWVFKQSSKFCTSGYATWGAGSAQNIPAVPTVGWKTKTPLI
jgi:hypothetical protein